MEHINGNGEHTHPFHGIEIPWDSIFHSHGMGMGKWGTHKWKWIAGKHINFFFEIGENQLLFSNFPFYEK